VVTDAPLLARFDQLLERIQQQDHRDLWATVPPYANRIEDTHIFSSNFYLTGLTSVLMGGFQLAPIEEDAYTVVDNQAIRSRGLTDAQYALIADKNRDVARAFERTEFVLTGNHDLTDPADLALVVTRALARYTSATAANQGFAGLDEQVAASVALATGLDQVPDPERQTFPFAHRFYRYARHDEEGQGAGVALVVHHDETIAWFDVHGPVTIGNERGFAEPYVGTLNWIAELLVLDYAAENGLDHGQGDDPDLFVSRVPADAADFFDHAARNDPATRAELFAEEIADDGAGGENAAGCLPGWTFDADGPLGRGCYRCVYPCLPGTTYDARLHVCVRDGQRQNCAPRHQDA
jgi:hypothetical protein